MKWTTPSDEHIIYEALSAIADNRIVFIDDNTAKCTSTSKGKYYTISYDSESKSIMSNDNMAYYKDEVSYPMVAMLILKDEIEFDQSILKYFKDIKWKDINQKNKNDYMKSVQQVLEDLERQGANIDEIKSIVNKIFEKVVKFELNKLGEKELPPQAY